MQFCYPARFDPDRSGAIIVSFRDFPECLTSGADKDSSFMEARDALEETVAGRIDDGNPFRCQARDVPASSSSRCRRTWLPRPRSPSRSEPADFRVLLSLAASGSTKKSCGACSIRVTTRQPTESTKPCEPPAKNSSWSRARRNGRFSCCPT